ncbi:MAG: iron-sulfur cluster assembly protein, partial [Bacteroidota bacterium]|nr:iron-sulfur cluster assembly protein [Bacteroidota bacterium]
MSKLSPDSILKSLKKVHDPDLRRDLVTLDMIKNLKIDGSDVYFDVELTTPACPLKDKIK